MQDNNPTKNITGLKYVTTLPTAKVNASDAGLTEVLDGTNGAAFQFTTSANVSDGTPTENMELTATTIETKNI